MGSRFEKFSERARRVLSLAQEEAQRFNHNYIGTEHILLGLVRETEGVAARVLSGLTIDLSKVRSAVEFIIGECHLGGVERALAVRIVVKCNANTGHHDTGHLALRSNGSG